MDLKTHWRLRLLELVKHAKLSQAAFAEHCGIPADYLSRLLYEPSKKGGKNLGPVTIQKIADAFNLVPGWFEMPVGTPVIDKQNATELTVEPSISPQEAADEKVVRVPKTWRPQQTTKVHWPFEVVAYDRIAKIKEHFGHRGKPDAIAEIDAHLDVLVARWEKEMELPKRGSVRRKKSA